MSFPSWGMLKRRKDNHMMATVEGDRGRRGETLALSLGAPRLGVEDVTGGPTLRAFKLCQVLRIFTGESSLLTSVGQGGLLGGGGIWAGQAGQGH